MQLATLRIMNFAEYMQSRPGWLEQEAQLSHAKALIEFNLDLGQFEHMPSPDDTPGIEFDAKWFERHDYYQLALERTVEFLKPFLCEPIRSGPQDLCYVFDFLEQACRIPNSDARNAINRLRTKEKYQPTSKHYYS